MTRKEFERLVEEGISRIPDTFRRYVREVAVVVKREASAEERRRARLSPGLDLLGLYEGTPRTERQYLPYRLPDKITVYQRAFERRCGADEGCIREEVARTIWHELAHALGYSERRIQALERRRASRGIP